MKMNVALIIIGVIFIVVGVVRIVALNNEATVYYWPEERVAQSEATTQQAAPVSPAQRDTIVVVHREVVREVVHTSAPTQVEIAQFEPTGEMQAQQEAKSEIDLHKEKGNQFEDFVVNLLADWRLKLLDRTQDAVSSAGVVAESCKNPDLHVQQKRGESKIDYYLECKYRSDWDNGAVKFEGWQLDRYRQFQRDNRRKVIIALGVGGTPSSPETFMLVPLDSISNRYNDIRKIQTQFAVEPTSSALCEYLNHYFNEVFNTAKQRRNNPPKQ